MTHPDSKLASARHLFSIPDFAAAHAISRTQVYREIAGGNLRASKVGKRTVITAENAAAWRGGLPMFDRKTA